MSGGKGGSSTSSVEIPEYIEAAAQRNLNKAERISQLGYVPQYGPSVAAFTPMQQAGFQNTASAAGAFGLAAPTTQQDIMGGMPAPTTYAGGVQGYSSTPLYEQMVAELAAQRPAQKSYIDSFFIDPVTGQYSASAMPAVDYTQMATASELAQQRAQADRDNALAIAQAQAQAGQQAMMPSNNALTPTEYQQAANTVAGPDYNPATDILTDEQRGVVMSDTQEGTDARIAQEDLAMGVIGNANNNILDDIRTGPVGDALNIEPSFDNPLSSGSYGGSLVTGRPSDSSQALFDALNKGSNFEDTYEPDPVTTAGPGEAGFDAQVAAEAEMGLDPFGGAGDPFNVQALQAEAAAARARADELAAVAAQKRAALIPESTTEEFMADEDIAMAQTGGGGDNSDGGYQTSLNTGMPSQANQDFFDSVNKGSNFDDDNDGGNGNGGCVVATHAVNAGAFTPSMKREAVVWCMHNLHDKWWGEAVRRGYRHLGNKKIAQGKAREHYEEFRRYVDFASGKKRTLKGALTFTLRTAQFFAVGLVKKDA